MATSRVRAATAYSILLIETYHLKGTWDARRHAQARETAELMASHMGAQQQQRSDYLE